MAISTDSILAALKAGTYTLDTLSVNNFFKTQQPEKRRRYPSVELLETPLGNTATQEKRDFIRRFDIRLFMALRGGATTGQEDEISSLEILESEVLTVMEATTLGEHKVTIEDKRWQRSYFNEGLRPYIMSILTITVRQITGISKTPDGILVFDLSNSEGDNLPLADYTYSQTFNTTISDGYKHIQEYTNEDANPKDYTGGFDGTLITHIRVSSSDFGATTDKLNQIRLPQANGELPTVGFIYTNKDQTTPTSVTITELLKGSVSKIDRLYTVGDNTVFRILCNLVQPSTIS